MAPRDPRTGSAGGAFHSILAAGLVLFPTVGAASKQAMAPIAIALAVILLVATLRIDARAALPGRAAGLLFAGFAGYVAAFHLPPALGDGGVGETIVKMGMLAVVLWLVSAGWITRVAPECLARIALWALAALAAGSGFLLIELLFDSPMHRLVNHLGPDVVVDSARHNRPTVALLLLSLPLSALLARQIGRSHAVLALALGAIPAFAGDSAAGALAALVAAVVYPIARWRPGAVLAAGAVVTVALVVAAPPLLSSAYRLVVQHDITMPMSFRDRLEIWDHGADAVADAPWIGRGLGAVKLLPMTEERRTQYIFHKAPSTHAHNAALQIWIEFGAVGIGLGLALLGVGAAAIGRMDRSARPAALSTAAALLVIAMLSFGVWQETWLGLIAVTLLLVRLAALPTAWASPGDVGS